MRPELIRLLQIPDSVIQKAKHEWNLKMDLKTVRKELPPTQRERERERETHSIGKFRNWVRKLVLRCPAN